MNLSNKCYPLFMIMILTIFSQIVSAKPLNQVTFACGQPFEYYAYGLSGYEFDSADELNNQWQARYEIPIRNVNGREVLFYGSEVRFSRIINDQQEIWLQLDLRSYDQGLEYGIYNATTDEFRLVSAEIDNLNLIVNQIFVDFNGTVWGIVEQSADENDEYTAETGYYPTMSDSRFFPLAYFDDNEQQFKLATGELTFDIRKDELRFTPQLHVVMDPNLQILWLFDEIGIYRYDPQMQASILVYSFSDEGYVRSVDIASSGEIYFSRIVTPRETSEMILYPVGSLFMLMPEDNSVKSINDPPQPLPNAHSLLIDHQDNLWLGPNAYQESETGSWHVLHPDIDFALDVGNFMMFLGWGYPELLLEDSSERIWFSGDNEYPYGASGLAWYDPTTGHGCKTTMSASNIIEDADGKLWFLDQGTRLLYQTVDSVTSFNVSLTLASLEEDTHEPQ